MSGKHKQDDINEKQQKFAAMDNLAITPIVISNHYETMAEMMQLLHQNERLLNDKSAPWPEIEESYMRHVITMQEENEGCCMVAYIDGVAAGFIFGYIEEPEDSRIELDIGNMLYISDGFVRPEMRRLGVYGKLNEAIEKHYMQMGIRRITRFTMVNNDKMRNLLETKGYKATRVLYEKWL